VVQYQKGTQNFLHQGSTGILGNVADCGHGGTVRQDEGYTHGEVDSLGDLTGADVLHSEESGGHVGCVSGLASSYQEMSSWSLYDQRLGPVHSVQIATQPEH
jgi:hypothetical protein